MSRYVDIDTLKIPSEEIISKWIINSAPSIDICFCRECKYFWKYNDLPTKCVFHLSLVNADDFCSYGVRNSSEKPNSSTTEDCSDVGKE